VNTPRATVSSPETIFRVGTPGTWELVSTVWHLKRSQDLFKRGNAGNTPVPSVVTAVTRPIHQSHTNATIAIDFLTDSKSVKRRSCQLPRGHPNDARHGYRYLYAIPVSVMPLENGRSKNMSRSRNYPYSMTLRLSNPMESELENLAYDRRMSKASFIRHCIAESIADAHDHRTPTKCCQNQKGAL
jgi:hypothetical protein